MNNEDGYLYLLQYVFGGQPVEGAFILPSEKLLVRDAIESLTPREAFVIRNRYLNKETLKVVASKLPRLTNRNDNKKLPSGAPELLGVSTERIRQIEAKALRKLRHPSRSRPLLPILERIFLAEEENV